MIDSNCHLTKLNCADQCATPNTIVLTSAQLKAQLCWPVRNSKLNYPSYRPLANTFIDYFPSYRPLVNTFIDYFPQYKLRIFTITQTVLIQ